LEVSSEEKLVPQDSNTGTSKILSFSHISLQLGSHFWAAIHFFPPNSPAMMKSGITWSREHIFEYVKAPGKYIPGTLFFYLLFTSCIFGFKQATECPLPVSPIQKREPTCWPISSANPSLKNSIKDDF
jgi:hypothetical protein